MYQKKAEVNTEVEKLNAASNAKACNILQEKYDIDEKYRVYL